MARKSHRCRLCNVDPATHVVLVKDGGGKVKESVYVCQTHAATVADIARGKGMRPKVTRLKYNGDHTFITTAKGK